VKNEPQIGIEPGSARPSRFRFEGDSPIPFEGGGSSPERGDRAATDAAADGLPGIRPFCGGRLIFVEIEDF